MLIFEMYIFSGEEVFLIEHSHRSTRCTVKEKSDLSKEVKAQPQFSRKHIFMPD